MSDKQSVKSSFWKKVWKTITFIPEGARPSSSTTKRHTATAINKSRNKNVNYPYSHKSLHWQNLPVDILQHCFSFLQVKDIIHVSKTCKISRKSGGRAMMRVVMTKVIQLSNSNINSFVNHPLNFAQSLRHLCFNAPCVLKDLPLQSFTRLESFKCEGIINSSITKILVMPPTLRYISVKTTFKNTSKLIQTISMCPDVEILELHIRWPDHMMEIVDDYNYLYDNPAIQEQQEDDDDDENDESDDKSVTSVLEPLVKLTELKHLTYSGRPWTKADVSVFERISKLEQLFDGSSDDILSYIPITHAFYIPVYYRMAWHWKNKAVITCASAEFRKRILHIDHPQLEQVRYFNEKLRVTPAEMEWLCEFFPNLDVLQPTSTNFAWHTFHMIPTFFLRQRLTNDHTFLLLNIKDNYSGASVPIYCSNLSERVKEFRFTKSLVVKFSKRWQTNHIDNFLQNVLPSMPGISQLTIWTHADQITQTPLLLNVKSVQVHLIGEKEDDSFADSFVGCAK